MQEVKEIVKHFEAVAWNYEHDYKNPSEEHIHRLNTVVHALKVLDKIMQEPTQAMRHKLFDAMMDQLAGKEIYEAMREQLLKEVG